MKTRRAPRRRGRPGLSFAAKALIVARVQVLGENRRVVVPEVRETEGLRPLANATTVDIAYKNILKEVLGKIREQKIEDVAMIRYLEKLGLIEVL